MTAWANYSKKMAKIVKESEEIDKLKGEIMTKANEKLKNLMYLIKERNTVIYQIHQLARACENGINEGYIEELIEMAALLKKHCSAIKELLGDNNA